MDFESIFRKASVALIAGAYALFVEAASVVQAQTQVIAGSPTVGSEIPHVATAERRAPGRAPRPCGPDEQSRPSTDGGVAMVTVRERRIEAVLFWPRGHPYPKIALMFCAPVSCIR
jgi:hypothetical protein